MYTSADGAAKLKYIAADNMIALYVDETAVPGSPTGAPADPDAGKIYYSSREGVPREASVLGRSAALSDMDSLTVRVQCAPDTTFNPWASIIFNVYVNGNYSAKEVKGTDESYTAGSLQSCELTGLGIRAGDTVKITAYTHAWETAADYVFQLSVNNAGTLFEAAVEDPAPTGNPGSSSDTSTQAPAGAPAKPTAAPSTGAPTKTPATEAPAEPTAAPATGTPTKTPSTETPAEPTTAPPTGVPTKAPATKTPAGPTAEPPAAPTTAPGDASAVKKGDTVTVSGLNYTVANVSEKTVKYADAKNSKKTSVTVPATIKVNVDGKKVTYKVTSIKKRAFQGNTKLKSVTIGKNIRTIEEASFKNCRKLSKIVIKSSKLTKVKKNALKGTAGNLVIKVPAKKVSAYKKLFKNKGNNSVVIKKA